MGTICSSLYDGLGMIPSQGNPQSLWMGCKQLAGSIDDIPVTQDLREMSSEDIERRRVILLQLS